MRPDEQPATAPETSRLISITIAAPPPPPFDSIRVWGALVLHGTSNVVKPNQTCEWIINTFGGAEPFAYAWYTYIGGSWQLIGSDQILDRSTGTTNFTLKGEATDANNTTRSKSVSVTVTSSGAACALAPGRRGPS
jgi:hypothetical protein